jgi:protein-disulfide isomerase
VARRKKYMDDFQKREGGAINGLRPKTAFKAGLLTGLGIMFVIGFFVLLGFFINSKMDKNKTSEGDNNNAIVNENTNDTSGAPLQPFNASTDWYKGNKNAKITLIEFSDLECPYCSRFNDTVNQLVKEYGDKIRTAFRHFPLTSLHPEALKKAVAVECVGEQGGNTKAIAFIDKLFADKPTVAQLPTTVTGLGLDAKKFTECLDANKYLSTVQNEASQAQGAGAQGTPYSILISGDTQTPVSGAVPYETLKAQIDSLLK